MKQATIYICARVGADGRYLLTNRRVRDIHLPFPIPAGGSGARLSEPVYELEVEPWSEKKFWRCRCVLTLQIHPDDRRRAGGGRLPRPFFESIWPLLNTSPTGPDDAEAVARGKIAGARSEIARRFLGLYWRMELERLPQIRASVSRLLCLHRSEFVADWLDCIAGGDEEERHELSVLLVETRTPCRPLRDREATRRDLQRLRRAPGARVDWRALYFRGRATGCSGAYLRSGLGLARLLGNPTVIQKLDRCERFRPATAIALARIARTVGPFANGGLSVALRLWNDCARNPGLVELIEAFDPGVLRGERLHALLLFWAGAALWPRYQDDPRRLMKFYRARGERLRLAFARFAPGYGENFREYMLDFYLGFTRNNPAAELERLYENLAERLSRKPFTPGPALPRILMIRLVFPNPTEVSDAALRHLDSARRSRNSWELTDEGLYSMLSLHRRFTRTAFIHFARKLLSVARLLGSLKINLRSRLLRRVFRHPLFAPVERTDEAVRDHCRFVDELLAGETGLSSPIDPKLRAHIFDGQTMSPRRLEYYERNFRRDLQFTRLELIERETRKALAELFPVREEGFDLHSQQVYSLLEINRTPLRKYLKARTCDPDYLKNHARSRGWLRRHPGFDHEQWLEGLRTVVAGPEERLTLAPEFDPAEVLKMGTYVSSCLGLGGHFMYNAAAVLLDVNKQVIFARDGDGGFIARQLVAISEEEQLVCYEVYPAATREPILRLFRDYDRALARAIGLPLYNDEDRYRIDCILARDYYDDLPWDFEIQEN